MELSTMADVSLQNVSKRFGAIEAVRELSLAVKDGEFVVLLGPSGAGKTTIPRDRATSPSCSSNTRSTRT
jgi:ABC-type Fe3+/spermidine/putrescine transport system ATPase subunit